MNKIHAVLVALVMVGVSTPAVPAAAFSDTAPADPQQQLAELNRQLDSDQARLNDLNNQVERAQGDLDSLSRKVSDDQQREAEVRHRLSQVARIEYERPALSLTTILGASSLDQLLGAVAQARLIARRQQALMSQASSLRQQDEQARDQEGARLVEIKKAQEQATVIAAHTLAMRDSAKDAVVQARAAAVAAQARANAFQPVAPPAASGQTRAVQTGTGSRPVASTTGPVALEPPSGNHFAYGYCTWHVANKRFIPWYGNAIDWWPNAAAYGYAEGQVPRVGSVMVTRESIVYGHVAYVESVNGDGSWTVSEMNYRAWNVVDMRTIHPGQVPLVGFIYGRSG